MNARLFPPCGVAVCHYCRAAIHPCRRWVADSGQRDHLSSSVSKLDCLRGYRWTCVDRLRRIAPGLSKVGERTDRPAQMRRNGWKVPYILIVARPHFGPQPCEQGAPSNGSEQSNQPALVHLA
jgi:hypothetical protein